MLAKNQGPKFQIIGISEEENASKNEETLEGKSILIDQLQRQVKYFGFKTHTVLKIRD